MVTISPPMIVYTQETFHKDVARPICTRQPAPPLQWTQPALLRNLYGHVCVKGRADNKKQLLADDFGHDLSNDERCYH